MIVNLRKVKGQLAARELACMAEENLDFAQIMGDLGISQDAVKAFDPLLAHGFFKSGRFDFDSYGEAVLAFVVNDPFVGFPLDVVAVSMAEPERFGTCKGQAALLGFQYLKQRGAKEPSAPCLVFHDPLEWLQNNGEGAVIIDPIPAATLLAATRCNFVSSDKDHAQELVDSGAIPLERLWVRNERWAA
jgi:hypothetical protein